MLPPQPPIRANPMYLAVEIYHDRVKIDHQYVFRPDHIAPSQWFTIWEAAIEAIKKATHEKRN